MDGDRLLIDVTLRRLTYIRSECGIIRNGEGGVTMADRAYAYMDWRGIEDIVYGEEPHPAALLAPRKVKEGWLYQCFFPGAKKVWLKDLSTGKRRKMACEDEAGYFAVVYEGAKAVPHHFLVDGVEKGDPYAVSSVLTDSFQKRFGAGIEELAYKTLGGHLMADGEEGGVHFALWAPNAARVSVIGEFNSWNGLAHPMEFHEESGIWELFIPLLGAGEQYAFELKLRDGRLLSRPDPFGTSLVTGARPVSVVTDEAYHWNDSAFLKAEKKIADYTVLPLSAYECDPDLWAEREGVRRGAFWREGAEKIAAYLSEEGFSHIELLPLMEYVDENARGYHTAGYFAPTARFGTAADLKYFVDTMHKNDIGVILDWTPAQFSADPAYLAEFDGTCLYEHLDPRQGVHPLWGTKLFNYGRGEVRSFLLSNAVYYLKEFHFDGLRLDGCATMLRQDYCRGEQYVANLYGTGDNLDGIEFLKQFTQTVKRDVPHAILSIEEDVDWPDSTSPVEDGGLGFDFEWNLHFTKHMRRYLELDAEGKKWEHHFLEDSMLYNYFKNSVISLSRGMGAFDAAEYFLSVNGNDEEKRAVLRAMYLFMIVHPGKKLFATGEIADHGFLRDLLALYNEEPALSADDFAEEGFEWIHTFDDRGARAALLRKSGSGEKLLAVFNFSDQNIMRYQTGVPCAGKYQELLNTDDKSYGGSGIINPRARASKPSECDERENSLFIRLAARSGAVFRVEE